MTNEHNNENNDFFEINKDIFGDSENQKENSEITPDEPEEAQEIEKQTDGEAEEETTDRKSSKHQKKQKGKKMKLWKKILLIILCIFLSLILIVAGTFGYLVLSGKSKLLVDNADIKIPENIDASVNDEDILTYNGEDYVYNKNIATILCMGIDTDVKSSGPVATSGSAGQADALYLVVMDTDTGKMTVVAIPRDTMAEVDVYSKSGTYGGVETKQICLAFSYGDGKDESCQNVARSVSRILLGMPINSYFAVDYRSIPAIHDAVGTVTVTPNENLEFVKNGYTYYFKEGKPTELPSHLAFNYLRKRDASSLNAAYLRMERQIDYIKCYGRTAFQKTKEDITFPVTLYNKIKKNSISNLDVSKITFLATSAVSNASNINLSFVKLQGEYSKGENSYAELVLDEEQIFETVISLFYKKVK